MTNRIEFPKVRSRAPLRLGLAGGGTDLSPYVEMFGGAVLNVTIDRYAFASCTPRSDGRVVFEADDLGLMEDWKPGSARSARLMLHQAVVDRMVKEFGRDKLPALTLRTTVDAPAGSGLGSSSALVVAIVDVMRELLGAPLGAYDVAHLAYEIERNDLGLSGGRQDQYAAAFGGVNFIEFFADDRVIVNPMRLQRSVLCELESSIVICFSGQSRQSAAIIDEQKSAIIDTGGRAIEAMHQLKADALEMKRSLGIGDILGLAAILQRSWLAKKSTAHSVSNERIERLLEIATANGALSGKVSGAGGGGFMFFVVHPEDRYRLIRALNDAGGNAGPVKFTDQGCETWIFN